MSKPVLLLLPNLIGDQRHHEPYLPSSVDKAVTSLNGLIAESETAGRRYLGRFMESKEAQKIPIALFNKNTPVDEIDFLLEPIRKGERWGYVSDSGLPCIADPGAELVLRARQTGIQVQAFVGPSSILLALMQSGLQGQQFAFHGYLEKDASKRGKQLLQLEKESQKNNATQIFMEPPFKNQQTMEQIVNTLSDSTWLCVAWDLTLPDQGIVTQKIETWKKSPLPNLQKRNALFLIYAE